MLSSWTSVDWQSLTFAGERHEASFRLTGPAAADLARRWIDGLEQADLPIGKGMFVADLTATIAPVAPDGSVTVSLEALTLTD